MGAEAALTFLVFMLIGIVAIFGLVVAIVFRETKELFQETRYFINLLLQLYENERQKKEGD